MATILVVEDDRGIRNLIAELLALAALAAVAREPPDPVLSDLMVPRLDGIGLRARLAQGGHRLPLVFLSATPGLAAGLGVPVVGKPFRVPALFAALAAGA